MASERRGEFHVTAGEYVECQESCKSCGAAIIYKPSPKVYQLVLDTLGVKGENICFVSANAWDVAGAAGFGFQVAHLNRFSQPPERLPGKPKAVLASLSELPALIG